MRAATATDQYQITLRGIGTGGTGLTIFHPQSQGNVVQATYTNIPTTPQSKATITLTGASQNYTLMLDINGDGRIDQQISPNIVISVVPPPVHLNLRIDEAEIKQKTFEIKGSFMLGAASNGINPLTENVSLRGGTFSTTIPPGSFKQDNKGAFKFEGTINGVQLEAVITPDGVNSFDFMVEAKESDLLGTVNPVVVTLIIGDDVGSDSINAEIN